MSYKARITDGLDHFDVEIHIGDLHDDGVDVAVGVDDGGRVVMERRSYAAATGPLLRLPREAVEALRDALNGYAPPRDDADVREALSVERARVDRILGSFLES